MHSFVYLQFGDISRNLDQQAKNRVSELTGKDEYKFGDLRKWADSHAKEKIANYTGKVNYEVSKILVWHEWREFKLAIAAPKLCSRAFWSFLLMHLSITSSMHSLIPKQVGDISKEVVRRAWAGEYELDDVVLAFR